MPTLTSVTLSGIEVFKLTGVPGGNGPTAISATGLQVGDWILGGIIVQSIYAANTLFENIISVNDEIQYVAPSAWGDTSGNTYNFIIVRGVLPY